MDGRRLVGKTRVVALVACSLCEAICGLEVTTDSGRVVAIHGDPHDPLSRGHLCPKALALQDIHEGDRLRTPIRRTSNGWVGISWDEAFDLTVDRLTAIRKQHGPDAVGVYQGNPTVHSLGALTHGTAFLNLLDTRNRFSATSVDQLPHQLTAALMFGHQFRLPVPDIDRTDHFLVIGANPLVSNGSMMTVPDFANRRKELRQRGGRMVVIDPRRTETAKSADEHHFIRPGTDAALLLAMIGVILEQTPGYDDMRPLAVPVDWAEKITKVTGIRRLATEFASAGRAVCYGRTGVSTQRHGLVCQWAIQVLNIITGNFDRPGGALFAKPAVDLVRITGHGARNRWRSTRGLPEFAGELPVSTLTEQGIRAMVVSAGNPALSTPDGPSVEKFLKTLDFFVAIDPRINETTRHADLILPPTTALERDHYDLIFHALAVRNTARFSPAVFPKPAEARHDWEIFRDLGLRYGRHFHRLKAQRLRLSPKLIVDALLRLGPYRLSLRKLRQHPHGIDLGPLTPSGPHQIDLTPPLIVEAAKAVKDIPVPQGLLLIGRRHLRANNSWMNDIARLTKGKPRHHLLMHPADCAERGITDGDTVRIRSAVGEIEVPVIVTDDIMPGVVSLPHGYAQANANALTDPSDVDASGNAVLNGVSVTVASRRG
ncbi:molybdopterin-dependent oxidoreductase [Actinokineospora sp. HUAS TT18]|uniref:molybdopterin-dependent oxidoreductase n=1 Tax=Actinokineospora sp. HUAS TT18 TaxID=3447451 RepID=UPI003F52048F